ncbi:hypothetical protein S40293_02402 [Stachybotrys chartarum IBT 40293]|nr:hypothetical protein S40293_02402 [Stachybotrys chartarum IBT 40293]
MQGFNMGRYVPPDLEGTVSANKAQGKHALGARASKLASHGVLTVRFEMPFAAWCGTCPKPTIIAQGVRFNAEKKRVGSYYSTPVWSFRFRHAECGGAVEMRTDPKNTAYVVVEGAAKRDTGDDKVREGDVVIMTDQEREALRRNAFASLEKTIQDRQQLKDATDRIHDLMDASARDWDDPYAQNQKLRRAFRAGRKERERDAAAAEDLKDRLSLGIDLLPASADDARRAALVDFGPRHGTADKALARPLFGAAAQAAPAAGPALKAEKRALQTRNALATEIVDNTRAANDPFLQDARGGDGRAPSRMPGVKRKRAARDDDDDADAASSKLVVQDRAAPRGLVNYDSD